jgi:transglutaminase-like putative cysteine protease
MQIPPRLRLRVGCEFEYDVGAPSPALVQVAPRPAAGCRVLEEGWEQRAATAPMESFVDLYGNTVRRIVVEKGAACLRYEAVVEVDSAADEVDPQAVQHLVEDLPPETMHFLFASRYCLSDVQMGTAWELFGFLRPGWARAQAICEWVHTNIGFEYGSSDSMTTSKDVYERRRGVCRDFAQLFIAFCRAMGLPARYVFGYLPDILVEPAPEPMDFCAWAEIYLGGRWWTFDPRNNRRRVGRVVIGRGRDAADAAMITIWGPATFRQLTVWADQVPP